MKLLALDTSGEACSAALLVDGEVRQTLEIAPRRHGELILPMMDELLREADLKLTALDALAFGRGPGSFTGVRIAAAVVQGAAFGANLPVVPVSTLAAMAQGAFRRHGWRHLLTALDARMDEVYWGCFEIDTEDLATPCGEERVCPPEQAQGPDSGQWYGVGHGWGAYEETLRARFSTTLADTESGAYCEARDVAVLGAAGLRAGRQVAPEQALPVYLRDQVTRKP